MTASWIAVEEDGYNFEPTNDYSTEGKSEYVVTTSPLIIVSS